MVFIVIMYTCIYISIILVFVLSWINGYGVKGGSGLRGGNYLVREGSLVSRYFLLC